MHAVIRKINPKVWIFTKNPFSNKSNIFNRRKKLTKITSIYYPLKISLPLKKSQNLMPMEEVYIGPLKKIIARGLKIIIKYYHPRWRFLKFVKDKNIIPVKFHMAKNVTYFSSSQIDVGALLNVGAPHIILTGTYPGNSEI